MVDFELGRVYRRAWEIFQRGFVWYLVTWLVSGFAYFFLILFLIVLGLLGFTMVGGLATLSSDPEQIAVIVLGSAGGLVLLLILIVGLTIISTFSNGVQIELTHQLYQGYQADLMVAFGWTRHRFWQYLWTNLLLGLATFLAFLLLVIPGLVAVFAWSLAPYLVAQEQLSGSRTLSRSWGLTSRAFGWTVLTLFLYWGGMLVLILLVSWLPGANALVSGVLAFFSMPLLGALYQELRSLEMSSATSSLGDEPVESDTVPADEFTLPVSDQVSIGTTKTVPAVISQTKKKVSRRGRIVVKKSLPRSQKRSV